MKLIPMTDFVLQNNNPELSYWQRYVKNHNYANFLKQPLKLEMFVPCDEKGNQLIFNYPQNKSLDDVAQTMFEKQYEKAKEKVLFEDFKIKDNVFLLNDKIFFSSSINAKEFFIHYETIEELSNHFLSNEIILTTNAIKKYEL